MFYLIHYNTGMLSCRLMDRETAREFAGYVSTKRIYPVGIWRIIPKNI